MIDAERYRLDPCPRCPPFWVSTRKYTARCADGMTGTPVTITRQYRSTVSLAHAQAEALRLARLEAESLLVCAWEYTACVLKDGEKVCCTRQSTVSMIDAQIQALKCAELMTGGGEDPDPVEASYLIQTDFFIGNPRGFKLSLSYNGANADFPDYTVNLFLTEGDDDFVFGPGETVDITAWILANTSAENPISRLRIQEYTGEPLNVPISMVDTPDGSLAIVDDNAVILNGELGWDEIGAVFAVEPAPEPPIEPSYLIQTDNLNNEEGVLWVSLSYGGAYESHILLLEGIDFLTTAGYKCDITFWVMENLTLDGNPIDRFRIQEGAGVDTVVSIAANNPVGSLTITNGNVAVLGGSATWDAIAVEFAIGDVVLLGQYNIDTSNFPQDGADIEMDWVYQSGTVFQGPQFPMGTYTVGDIINVTDQVMGSLEFFGSPLVKIRLFHRQGMVKTLREITIEEQIPSGTFTIANFTGVDSDLHRTGPTAWAEITRVIIGFPAET